MIILAAFFFAFCIVVLVYLMERTGYCSYCGRKLDDSNTGDMCAPHTGCMQ